MRLQGNLFVAASKCKCPVYGLHSTSSINLQFEAILGPLLCGCGPFGGQKKASRIGGLNGKLRPRHKDSTMTYVDAYSYSSTSSCFFPISSRQALYQYQLVFRLRSTDSHTCFEGGVRAFTQLVNKTSALQGGSSLCDSVKVFLLNVSNNSWNLSLVELHNECYISTLECGVGIRIQTNRYAEKVSTKSNQSFQNCQF